MECIQTSFPDVLIFKQPVYEDDRGFFHEIFRQNAFSQLVLDQTFVQDNHSGSRKGTLRGLHYQIYQPQGKLISVIMGEIYDVVVDLRKSSNTFGKWLGLNLSSEDKQQLWVPPGYAHGFYVLSEWAEIVYKTTTYYASEWDRTLLWNDSNIGIDWPLINGEQPLLSKKDANGTLWNEAELFD